MHFDRRSRNLLLATGTILLGLVLTSMLIRQVDPIEIVATALFVPIFVGAVLFGLRGGAIPALVATVVYLILRYPAIRLVGLGPLFGLVLGRAVGFLAFGIVGGWAAGVVGESLTKLALFDEIDDATRLHNARSLVAVLDRERSRVTRYSAVFSVVHASFAARERMTRSVRARLRALGTKVAASVRVSDHAAHFSADHRSHLVIVLPDTSAAGALTVAVNLEEALRSWGADDLTVEPVTLPGDEERVRGIETLASATVNRPD